MPNPVAPAPLAPPVAPAPQGGQWAEPATQSVGTVEPSVLRPPGTFVFQAHVGFEAIGTGHAEDSCTSTTEGECRGTINTDFDDRTPIALALEGLLHAAPGVRLGLGYWLLPYSGFRASGTKFHVGHEHALNAIIEGLVPLRPRLALSLRVHAGARMLISGGDLAQSQDAFLASCSDLAIDTHCEASKGPFFGGTFGTMAGIIIGSEVRGRVDLALERHFEDAGDRTTSNRFSSSTTFNSTLYGTRFWLLGGIEL